MARRGARAQGLARRTPPAQEHRRRDGEACRSGVEHHGASPRRGPSDLRRRPPSRGGPAARLTGSRPVRCSGHQVIALADALIHRWPADAPATTPRKERSASRLAPAPGLAGASSTRRVRRSRRSSRAAAGRARTVARPATPGWATRPPSKGGRQRAGGRLRRGFGHLLRTARHPAMMKPARREPAGCMRSRMLRVRADDQADSHQQDRRYRCHRRHHWYALRVRVRSWRQDRRGARASRRLRPPNEPQYDRAVPTPGQGPRSPTEPARRFFSSRLDGGPATWATGFRVHHNKSLSRHRGRLRSRWSCRRRATCQQIFILNTAWAWCASGRSARRAHRTSYWRRKALSRFSASAARELGDLIM